MNWVNYHHLFYFWMAARERSITNACKLLQLSQPTVSEQIRELEKSLKTQLFERSGRSIRLTDAGQVVFRYADEIFTLGRELQNAVAGQAEGLALRVVVGVADTLPKLLVHRLLTPVMRLGERVRLTCIDGEPNELFPRLANHELDLVVSDFPASPHLGLKTFNHLLSESGVTFLGANDLARRYRRGFPKSLDGAPMLLPDGKAALRRSLEQWFDEQGVRPLVKAEFTDSALLKAFGHAGDGLFVVPTAVEDEVRRMLGVGIVGREPSVRERVYAISVEKRVTNRAVLAIAEAARQTMSREQTQNRPS